MDLKSLIQKVVKRPKNIGDTEFNNIDFDVTDTYTISGQKGTGKSYFMSVLANEFPNVVFWDARWERFTKNDKSALSTKAIEMPKKWVTTKSPEDLKQLLYRGKTHIIYHPAPLEREKRGHEDLINEFDDVAQIIYDFGNVTFFVDEADNVCDLFHISEGFFNVLEYGKHRNVGVVAATRRLQHLNPRIPRLSTHLFFFRLSGKDFKYINEFLPPEDKQFDDTLKYDITALEDRHFYHFDGKELTKFLPITIELT